MSKNSANGSEEHDLEGLLREGLQSDLFTFIFLGYILHCFYKCEKPWLDCWSVFQEKSSFPRGFHNDYVSLQKTQTAHDPEHQRVALRSSAEDWRLGRGLFWVTSLQFIETVACGSTEQHFLGFSAFVVVEGHSTFRTQETLIQFCW